MAEILRRTISHGDVRLSNTELTLLAKALENYADKPTGNYKMSYTNLVKVFEKYSKLDNLKSECG